MGILDDAIKEHLELKRQHGAGDDELKKIEDEAFGAAERPGEPDSAPVPSIEEREAIAEQPTEMYDIDEELGDSPAPPEDELVEEEEPPAEQDEEEDADDFFDEKRLSDELDQALEGPEELEEDEEEEEDVLEETPDFLEEAPEDDQLWFEQKPPKDFDFDD